MKKVNFLWMLLAGVLLFSACSKDEDFGNPTIAFSTEEGFISADGELAAGEQFQIKIEATWNENDKITNYIVYQNDEKVIDEGINEETLSQVIDLTKTDSDEEIVKIIVRDAADHEVETSITLTKAGEAYGNILSWEVTLGAQDNASVGTALKLTDGTVYNLEDGSAVAADIDILYYYDGVSGDNNTIASPGANADGIYSGDFAPENWDPRNETRFSKSAIEFDDAVFDAMENDELIIANPAGDDAKRKAKKLSNGKYFAFKTAANKNGIFRVEEVIGEAEGSIKITIKVQE
jgi:hypothetical protein